MPPRKHSPRTTAGGTIFITGTDTNSGKTTLATMLLLHCAQAGIPASAIKPICSGGKAELFRLARAHATKVKADALCHRCFPQALAPWPASELQGPPLRIRQMLRWIDVKRRAPGLVLIEGCGGILVPLTKRFMVADLISELGVPVVVSAWNRLGVINHIMLTYNELRRRSRAGIQVVLLNSGEQGSERSEAESTNFFVLTRLLGAGVMTEVFGVKHLAGKTAGAKKFIKKLQKPLAQILGRANL